MKIAKNIKIEYKNNPTQITFMGAVLGLALLTYLKPTSTTNILSFLGLTALNFFILTGIIFVGWYFFVRKK